MIKTNVLAAVLLGAGMATSTIAQQGGNGDVPRTQYIATMDGEFRKMDGDKNGQITRAEVETFERGAALGQARARAAAKFAELDTDRNGQISPVELNKLITGTPAVDGRPLIGKLDTNKDGQISLIEHRGGKLSYFDQIDRDKDGNVSVAEMKTAGVIK
ncbi:MAG: hypothetical protein LH485_07925 [Sphingomonas bacterium]|nr:hypothetical protein [Sphingomonas bacterium]